MRKNKKNNRELTESLEIWRIIINFACYFERKRKIAYKSIKKYIFNDNYDCKQNQTE